MHRVFSLKIEVCYLDNAAFLGCFLFGLPSTRTRHCYCKKTNSNSACALEQSDSSFTAFPSFQTSTGKKITGLASGGAFSKRGFVNSSTNFNFHIWNLPCQRHNFKTRTLRVNAKVLFFKGVSTGSFKTGDSTRPADGFKTMQ